MCVATWSLHNIGTFKYALISRLNEDLLVKVADFGLSKENYQRDPYPSGKENKKRALPIRWMSIEAILFGLFTTQSDVVRSKKVKTYLLC